MTKENEILSDIIIYMKYAKFIPELERRETWDEICTRNMNMHIKRYPQMKDEIQEVYRKFVYTKKVLPSMRSMQFAGKAIEVNNIRMFNCSFLPIDSIHAFSETMFLLLSGVGVGYSIQEHNISQLPRIQKPNPHRTRKYVIQDSIVGWADAVKVLIKSYTGFTNSTISFDFNEIREKGMPLITAGGKAPGPGPLKIALAQIENVLASVPNNSKLNSSNIHDILCFIADAVLAGGIRRSAMISFFDADDESMLSAKSGNWWELNPQRGRANNSVMLHRGNATFNEFETIWEKTKNSKAGEPGFYFTNNLKKGSNPCVEIALDPYGVCNLTEGNGSTIKTQKELNEIAKASACIGTLQAGYTDFHYVREKWREVAESEALLGCSFTGIADKYLLELDFKQAADIAIAENKRVAKLIGINSAARITAVKPAGTTSLVLGTSSGIHAYHNDYYLRRIRIGKNEALYTYLAINHPELLEDDKFIKNTAIICVPQKAPDGAITRNESAISLLERVKKISKEWVKPGHITGDNSHNVSCTISIKDNEWDIVKEWMWVNRDHYNGISVLPYDNGTYVQAPFEDITKERYEELVTHLKEIDLSKVVELQDDTSLQDQAACSGASCEIS